MNKRIRMAPLLLLMLAAVHAQRPGSSGNTCPDSCPDSTRPVCSTNNVVYRNECLLRRAACINSSIKKRNDGPCVSDTAEPRECKKRCSSSYQPYCATNGRTYDNRCKLSRATCNNSNIKERYEGVCDVPADSSSSDTIPSIGVPVLGPSSSDRRPSVGDIAIGAPVRPILPTIGAPVRPIFPAGTQSNVNPRPATTSAPIVITSRPVLNCPDICSLGFRPVCGTDGQVYGNNCKLRVAICKNPNLQKRNDGVCEKDCSIECPLEINYVCGTDGRTYINDCELTVARCKDPAVKKVGNGPCAVFRETNNCNVEACERIYDPVCGSDGVTYQNRCQFQNRACVDQSLLRLHSGECVEQKCAQCSTAVEPVCGTDGVTYLNHCTLIRTSCRTRNNLAKFADGRCRQSNNG